MYRTRLLGDPIDGANKLQFGYIEMDPSGRYGRFRDILGKGATKTVYKAFDEVLGMEVAWNQVKLNDVFRSPEELQRLYSEVHILKNLDHHSIMRFHASWIDVDRATFNFITEMFTSGNLREYINKYKRVNIRAIKNWARQILQGLAYLHGHDPPVIHRDLKCDNIFVNGHLAEVKVGDLGLAAILHGSQHAHSVIGTPEFMAPELYEEEYDELVDIYSFGMCVLEMLTSEYPYGECSNPAQIYKKVTTGKLPAAFYRIHDLEARKFVGRCLETASKRPSASELLMDPFLATEDDDDQLLPFAKKNTCQRSSSQNGRLPDNLPNSFCDAVTKSTDMTITGTLDPEDDTIFLKVQISDKNGQARNIYFPFDISSDTAMDVASEMVKELEITDWKPLEIAKMIDAEISALVPNWKKWSSAENHGQHSFKYSEDRELDDDDSFHHPFHSLLSHSSSEASLPALFNSRHPAKFHEESNVINSPVHDWLEEELKAAYDDSSSYSSLNSYEYSNLSYCLAHEHYSDHLSCHSHGEESLFFSETSKGTRICPRVVPGKKYLNNNCRVFSSRENSCSSLRQQKMTRVRSLVDMRSQLLHQSLVHEVHKRRLFKTVGAVENIGYQEPGGFSDGNSLTKGNFQGRSAAGNRQVPRFEW